MNKEHLLRVIQLFTNAVGGSPIVLLDILFTKFKVDDFAYHDDMYFWGVMQYFENKVIPHKIEVYKAGEYLMKHKISANQVTEFRANLWIHDLSKLSANEAFGYAMYDFKNPNSPNKEQFEKAWHHHKMNNPHHPEYWLNPNRGGVLEIIEMPEIYILEMVADWIGAGVTYGNTLEKWLPDNLHKFVFHPKSLQYLQEVLVAIGIQTKKLSTNSLGTV